MRTTGLVAGLIVGLLAFGSAPAADATEMYDVTVTNVTRGVAFTPILVATHSEGLQLFTLGKPADDSLAMLAEGGDTEPLAAIGEASAAVGFLANSADFLDGPPLLFPGESVTLTIEGGGEFTHLTLASMMLPTNDGFISLQNVLLPGGEAAVTYTSPGYDAGSEENDEACISIPGPQCGGAGEGYNEAGGEGYVHIHAGIHGTGDLAADAYDWRNPVAQVVITRK